MEQSPFKNKKFKSLQKLWYKKLAKTGFVDIENTNLPDPDIKKCDVIHFNKVTPDEYETRTKYYSLARGLLNTFAFESELHKKIWEYHSEGISTRKIEKLINEEYKSTSIKLIIQKIKAMGMPR